MGTPPPMDEEALVKGEMNGPSQQAISELPFASVSREFQCKASHVEITFIHMESLVHLHVNKSNLHTTRTCFETEAKGNSEIAYCSTGIRSQPGLKPRLHQQEAHKDMI